MGLLEGEDDYVQVSEKFLNHVRGEPRQLTEQQEKQRCSGRTILMMRSTKEAIGVLNLGADCILRIVLRSHADLEDVQLELEPGQTACRIFVPEAYEGPRKELPCESGL